jgi:hypothetical protein
VHQWGYSASMQCALRCWAEAEGVAWHCLAGIEGQYMHFVGADGKFNLGNFNFNLKFVIKIKVVLLYQPISAYARA